METHNATYAYNGHYSAMKRNEVRTHATTWTRLEDIMLSEGARQERINTLMIPLDERYLEQLNSETESAREVTRGWRMGSEALPLHWWEGLFMGKETFREYVVLMEHSIMTVTNAPTLYLQQ